MVKSGKDYIDKKSIKAELDQWQWPLYFFDFETNSEPIPRFKGDKPYTPIPFQYSCHVWKSPGSELEHFEYLHIDETDPREPLVKSIIKNFGKKGSVVAYSKGYEAMVLTNLADRFPKHKKALLFIKSRLVDPLPIIKNNIYLKEFKGSFSIKKVAPALIGEKLSYKDLDVADGTEAQAVVEGLITLAMVGLVKWLFRLYHY